MKPDRPQNRYEWVIIYVATMLLAMGVIFITLFVALDTPGLGAAFVMTAASAYLGDTSGAQIYKDLLGKYQGGSSERYVITLSLAAGIIGLAFAYLGFPGYVLAIPAFLIMALAAIALEFKAERFDRDIPGTHRHQGYGG